MTEHDKTAPRFTVGGPGAVFTLVVVTLLYVVNYMDRMVLSATLPLIKADLMLTDAQCGWLGTIYFIVVALLTIPAAILCDRWSRKKSLAIMALLWTVSTFLTGMGNRFAPLFAARGGVGVGEAGFAPGGIAFVSGSFKEESRARVMGVFNLGQPLGSILGIVIAGVVAQANLWGMGWRSPFFLFAVPGVLLGILVLFTRDYPTTPITVRSPGGGQIGVMRGLLVILKTPTLLLTSLGVGALSFVGGAVGHWLPTYFVRTRHIDVAKASYLMGGIILVACAGPVLGGILADKWKRKKKNARPLTAAVISLLLGVFLYIGFSVDIAGVFSASYPIFMFAGILMFAYTAPAYAVTQDLVPRSMRSISMGLLVLITYGTLGAYSPVVVGWLSDLMGSAGEPNLTAAFLFVPPVAFLGSFLFFMAARFHDRDVARISSGIRDDGDVGDTDTR
ncbi:MAG: MFS transporter [Deltaproteobacteria bacterium]|nr:MFS transporter [Candidatus Zymogenaceae bacterium]